MEENKVIEMTENKDGVAVVEVEKPAETGTWLQRNGKKLALALAAGAAAILGAKRQYAKGYNAGYDEALDDVEESMSEEETTETVEVPE